MEQSEPGAAGRPRTPFPAAADAAAKGDSPGDLETLEQRLRAADARYRRLVESVTDYLYTVRVAGGRALETTHGPGCAGVTGYGPAEFAADPLLWLRMVPEEDQGVVLAHAARVLADEAEGPIEHRIVHKDGTVRWVRNTPVPLHDGAGRLVGYDGLVQDITAEKLAEQTTREKAEQFRALFESSPTAFWLEDASELRGIFAELRAREITDLDRHFAEHPGDVVRCLSRLRVIDVNQATVALHEAGSKERLLAGVERTFTPEALAAFAGCIAALFRGERSRHYETTYRTLRGRLLHCLVTWSVVPGSEESLSRVIVAVTDISDRHRTEEIFRRIAEELLSRTGAEYFAALTAFVARELVCEFAFIGRMVDAGARVRTLAVHAAGKQRENFTYDLAGTPCETVVGRNACFYPDAVQERFPADSLLGEMGARCYAGVPLFASDGRPLGLFAALGSRAMAPADADRVLSLLRVLSARAAAEIERGDIEEALREREAFVRHILDSVDEAFIVVDRDYRIVSCNRAYLEQTGLEAAACAGRFCHEVSHRRDTPCWQSGEECAVRRVFETGEPHSAIHDHPGPGGGWLRVETKAFPLRDAAGEVSGAIEVINNISDRVRLEEQLRQAQKMEAVGLLAGGVAHDFNNILSAIIGYGNLLEMKLPRDSECRPFAEQILSAGERAAGLTQSLLAFSRKQVINPRPLDVNDVIRTVEKLLRRVLGEDVELHTELSAGQLRVVADSGQVEQVLLNLATNARDAMPGGGTLTIATAACAIDEAFVRANGFGKPGPYARIEVTDTGIGMSEQVRARVFEPFFTTKELGRGTGLGLAMVYGAVRQNQGHVSVSSAPGQGATFRVWLPLSTIAPDAAPARPPMPSLRGSGRVLVAEDDATVRRLLSAVLTEFGYEVAEAADGLEALALAERSGGAFDLCILDVVMPRLNGREAWERLRARYPALKALFISGYTADIIHRRGVLDAGLNFLSKPVMPQVLLEKVREILT